MRGEWWVSSHHGFLSLEEEREGSKRANPNQNDDDDENNMDWVEGLSKNG